MSRRKNITLIATLIIIIILLIVFFNVFKIKDIEVEGSEKNTQEEIIDYIFENRYESNTLIFFLESKFADKKSIPFIETYDVEIVNIHKVKITVYEKSIVGYIQYMGSNMYFDKDGIVVESSSELIENVPLITGLNFDYIVLNSKLPVENDEIFNLILDLTQGLQKYSIEVDKIYMTEDMEITLHIGDVKVELGSSKDLSQKLSDLSDLVENLDGRSGTLDMKEVDTEGSGYVMKVN
jgi:cell division protein FtsQ